MNKAHSAAPVLAFGISLPAATAAVVSYNVDNNGTLGNPDGSYNSTQTAGVYATVGWLNDWFTYPTTNLMDDSGTATTIDISVSSTNGTWSANGFAQPGQDADLSWNKTLMAGYLNGTGAAGSSITISDISYTTYDIYVYFTADDSSRTGTVTDGTTTYSFNVLDNQLAGGNALFAQTTDTGSGNPEANYAIFSGLSGSTQTISTDFGATYGGIAGFQIVDTSVPEPSVALLGGIGVLGLLRRRRY